MITLTVQIEEIAPSKSSIVMKSDAKNQTELELSMYAVISESVRLANNFIAGSAKTSEIISGNSGELLQKEFEEAKKRILEY